MIERSFNDHKQWRGLASRYDKLALVYRGGIVLRAILIWLRQQQGHTPYGAGRNFGPAGRAAEHARTSARGARSPPVDRAIV